MFLVKLMGLWFVLEGLGSLIHFRKIEGGKNRIFQLGRLTRIILGLVLTLIGD